MTCLSGCDHLSSPHGVCRSHGEALHRRPEGDLVSIVCDCPAPRDVAAEAADEVIIFRRRALGDVHLERLRQDGTWGEQNHPDGTGLALPEPFRGAADQARRLCQHHARQGTVTWRHILMEEVAEALEAPDPAALRAELVQVAAVAVAWVEAIDRRQT